jgi:hypothetical protein
VAAAARCLRFLELLVDFLAPLFGDAPSHPHEVVLDAERDHALRGCCVFLIFEDHAQSAQIALNLRTASSHSAFVAAMKMKSSI